MKSTPFASKKGIIIRVICTLLLTLSFVPVFAQGGTHPGFDPSFGAFAPLENRILLIVLIVVAIVAVILYNRRKKS